MKEAEISHPSSLTGDSRVLVQKILKQWTQELPRIIRNTDELAQEVRFHGIEGRTHKLVDLIDTAQLLVECLIQMESEISLEATETEEWRKLELHLGQSIGEALKAFENKDFILFSELLEYDVADALQRWNDLFLLILSRVDSHPKP